MRKNIKINNTIYPKDWIFGIISSNDDGDNEKGVTIAFKNGAQLHTIEYSFNELSTELKQ